MLGCNKRLGKTIEPKVHLYLVQIFDDRIEGGNKWVQIKTWIKLNEYLNEEQ